MSYRGLVGLPTLDYSTLAVSRRTPLDHLLPRLDQQRQDRTASITEDSKSTNYELPAFVRILNLLLIHTQPDEKGSNNFITNVLALHDVAFSPKCPILGTGHHFAVYASPFDSSEDSFRPVDGRAFNNQVYCMKAPNFATGGNSSSGPAKEAFRKEYYETALQELRVLLHPDLRNHENIISLFGLDFQEDYDDCSIAWPVLLMENAEYGTLDTLQQDIRLDSDLSRLLLLDVARGIQALHQCNIIHGDVKSENVLICRHHHHQQRPYIARLSDFGLSLINPDPSRKHRLPGGTFLWQAPESELELSVEEIRQTDVYSFGLTAWRVLVHDPNPYGLIPLAALGLQPAVAPLNEVVSRAKEHPHFTQLVLRTLEAAGVPETFGLRIVEATLRRGAVNRDLGRAAAILASDGGSVGPKLEPSETYWALEEPSLVMEQLEEAFPDRIIPYIFKASMIRSLVSDLEAVFSYTGPLARSAGWLLFKFAASPQFQVAWKDIDDCCRILIQLCHLGSALGQAIVARYHEIHGREPEVLKQEWLQIAASNGSYYALESLRRFYPEDYRQLMGGPLDFEHRSADLAEDELDLLRCCRAGNYESSRMLLEKGAPAFPSQDGMVSALHWLVSFQDERQINHLLELLLGNGAVLNAWEGETDDFGIGRIHGTPLHWAIWHRNVSLVRALTKAESRSDMKQVERALWIAAIMHFYDVLEILKAWILELKDFALSEIDWYPSFLLAADQSTSWLPLRLRHGSSTSPEAFERTMDTILGFYRPSAEDVTRIFAFSIHQNQPALVRYLYRRLDLDKRKDLLHNVGADPTFKAIAMGFIEVLEVFIEKGLANRQSEHGVEKWKPLQMCCFIRQRDLSFARRLLAIGCRADDVGGTDESKWSPFFIAVSVGLYQVAVLLLEHGADKDYVSGWMGGFTVTMNLMLSWPDIPLSRLKFLLEEVPRLGFGHVTFWGWPGAGGNLMYALSCHHWSSYSAGYRLGETAKYVTSQLQDKSCLNMVDKVGATALRMACANGNIEIIRTLIENGQDPNLAMGFSPLRNAKEWLATCQKREKEALKGKPGSERRLARMLRVRAEETMQLLQSHGAVDRGFLESIDNSRYYLTSSQWQKPSLETALEMFSAALDPSLGVNAGSTPLQPTTRAEFRVHHGKKSVVQSLLGGWGRQMDQAKRQYIPKPTPRYQLHNCLPWRSDNCVSCYPPACIPERLAQKTWSPAVQWQLLDPAATSTQALLNRTSDSIQWQTTNPAPFLPGSLTPSSPPAAQWQSVPLGSMATRDQVPAQSPNSAQWQPPPNASPSSRPNSLRAIEAVVERIQHLLLQYFCDGGGAEATEGQRRDKAEEILKAQLHTPIIVNKAQLDIGHCEEFSTIKKVVETCLEVLHVGGLRLVPELSEDGVELVVYIGH